jgi:hypothetical protein
LFNCPIFGGGSYKRKNLKTLSIILALAILGILFFKFGRNMYMPVINKLKGKETVEQVINKIESDVWNRLQMNLRRII